MTGESRKHKFDAFISYSHLSDSNLGASLQHLLCRLAKPWYRRRALTVFRDANDLSVNPDLWGSIVSALDESAFLVLLASPEAADSKWVPRELLHWLDTDPGASERILIVLAAGEIHWSDIAGDFDWAETTALPEALRGVFPREPLWVDFRGLRKQEELTRRNPLFFNGSARLAAAIRQQSLADVIGRDLREHRRTLRYVWSAGFMLLVLTFSAIFFAIQSNIQAREAQTQRDRALASATGSALQQVQVLGQREPSLALDMMLDESKFNTEQKSSAWALLRHRYDRLRAEIRVPGLRDLIFQNPDSRQQAALLIVTSAGQLQHWLYPDGEPETIWTGPTEANFQVSRDGLYLASERDGSVIIYDIQADTVTEKLRIGSGSRWLRFVPNREALILLDENGDLTWWDFDTPGMPTHIYKDWLSSTIGKPEQDEYVDIDRRLTGLAVLDEENVWSTSSTDYDGGEFHGSNMRRSNLLTQTTSSVDFKWAHRTHSLLAASKSRLLVHSVQDDRATIAPPELTLIDTNSGSQSTYIDMESELTAMDVDFGGSSIAVLTADNTVHLLDGNLQDTRLTLRPPRISSEDGIQAIAISAGSEWVAVATQDGGIRLFGALREAIAVNDEGPRASFVATLAINAFGDQVAIGREGPGSEDSFYSHWYPLTGEYEEVSSYDGDFVYRDRLYTAPLFKVPRRDVLAADPDGAHVLILTRTSLFAGSLEVLDGKTGLPAYQLPEHTDSDARVTVAVVGSFGGAVAFSNRSVMTWSDGGARPVTSTLTERVRDIHRLPEGWAVVTLSDEGSELSNWEFFKEPYDESYIEDMKNGTLWVAKDHEAKSPLELLKLEAGVSPIQGAMSATIMNNGEHRILVGKVSGEISLVNVADRSSRVWNPGFSGPIIAVHLFQDGDALVTGKVEASRVATFLVNALTQTVLYELRIDNLAVTQTAFAASGNAFVAATMDGRVWKLDLPPEQALFKQ